MANSNKMSQILTLKPASEIVFEGPFNQVVTSYLELRNPTPDKKICFKVKTTAPRRYCVRPNSGIIEPGKTIKIAIMLQPIEQEAELEKGRHKFMVQSAVIVGDDVEPDTIWYKTDQRLIMDSKLRCVFQSPKISSSSSPSTTTSSPQLAGPKSSTPITADSNSDNNKQTSSGDRQPLLDLDPSQQLLQNEQRSSFGKTKKNDNAPSESEERNLRVDTAHNANKSQHELSSQNLSSSSFQKINQGDYTLVYIALLMLILGVVLGKYLI